MTVTDLFANIPQQLPEELFTTLAEGKNLRIERIVSRGQQSPADFWYDQEQAEFVLLLQGEAQLVFAEPAATVTLRAGQCLTIAPHRRHRVAWTTPAQDTIWLAVLFDPD